MRDGVVDVQQVQLVAFGHFGHVGGERERIGRVLEQRVVSGTTTWWNERFGTASERRDGIAA